jgi:hypothetical protein
MDETQSFKKEYVIKENSRETEQKQIENFFFLYGGEAAFYSICHVQEWDRGDEKTQESGRKRGYMV